MQIDKEKIYNSGREGSGQAICGHCRKPMEIGGLDNRVYHYNGCFHFLCNKCKKKPYYKVDSCNTASIFYEDKDGMIYNVYDIQLDFSDYRTITGIGVKYKKTKDGYIVGTIVNNTPGA